MVSMAPSDLSIATGNTDKVLAVSSRDFLEKHDQSCLLTKLAHDLCPLVRESVRAAPALVLFKMQMPLCLHGSWTVCSGKIKALSVCLDT